MNSLTGAAVRAAPVTHTGVRPVVSAWVHDSVTRQALALPQATAIHGTGTSITFQQLDQESNRLARHLQSMRVGLEVPVGLYLERSPDFAVAALAVLKAGGAYVPLDPSHPPDRIAAILEDSQAAVLLSHKWMAAGLRSGVWSTVDLDIDAPQIERYPGEGLGTDGLGMEVSGSNLAYIIYTSGSTGRPKGVEVTHSNLAHLIDWHRRAFSITPADRASQLAGLAFDAAVWEVWCHLAAGASLDLIDETSRRSPEDLRDWLVRHKITVAFAPTTMAEHLIRLDWPPNTALRILLTGADILHRYPRAGLPFTLVNNYGPTECTVLATSGTVPPDSNKTKIALSSMGRPTRGRPTLGHPIDGMIVQIVDPLLRPVPEGESGEICIAGPQVARGYRNLPELTAEKFVARQSVPGGRIYRTGDLGRILPDGDIAFLGRIDDQIKIRGFRVEPGDIAAQLDDHAGIEASVVIARGGNGPDRALVAYLVPAPGFSPTSAGLREFLASRLPDYMIPSAFVRLDSLPVTTAGKCDKDALPAPSAANLIGGEEASVSALGATEEKLIQLLRPLMNSGPIGRDDNFFFIGGHSMMAAQLMARIDERFGVRLTLRQLFEAPTAASLAKLVDQHIK
ncbi:MAG: non-ribosomal peptide synthetase [Acidobacteriota bacterium]|nr:non-ribosomal peptide synthetase [Acidobacteriota bacterium]